MKPSLLQPHLQTNRPKKKDRDPNYFKRLGESTKKQGVDYTGKQYQQSVGMVTASYEMALIVAKNKKPHTIKELIMPGVKVLVKHVIGDEASLKLNSASWPNITIQRRNTEMFTDIIGQALRAEQSSKYRFAILLGKTTDVSNCAQLLVFVRYATKDSTRSELLLSNE